MTEHTQQKAEKMGYIYCLSNPLYKDDLINVGDLCLKIGVTLSPEKTPDLRAFCVLVKLQF
jgi:hypothetical protein